MGAIKGRIPWNKGLQQKIKVNCCICKKPLDVYPSRFKALINHYCSKACYNKAHYKIVKCAYCDKEKVYTISQYEQKKKMNQHLFFCSIKCSQKYHLGKNSALYGKPSWCKGLTKNNSEILKGKSKKMCGVNNPMFNKKLDTSGCNFYFEDLGHRCRSSWEVNFARTLRYLNINYEYESRTFNLNKGDSYTPDFYLKDFDLYIEVKGYMTNKFKEKFIRFKKEYSKVNILVIDETIFKIIKERYCEKIEWQSEGKIKNRFDFKPTAITKIVKSNFTPKRVYNLSIKDDESFIVNGIVVHNTKPTWFIRDTLEQELLRLLVEALKQPGAIEIITQES